MSLLDVYRKDARDLLAVIASSAAPEWRVCFTEDGSEEPTGIAPVCADDEHDPDDGSVYNCCPAPAIECFSSTFADYLAALLNSDRSQS
ncbi:hypothetical protein ACFCZV_13430 [Streptomyces hydrogenans]|uniref:hypothetical protein n=1 Tax=Streptomyces hydrogenans TaxID=1873719 RepID=UPI0035DC62BD